MNYINIFPSIIAVFCEYKIYLKCNWESYDEIRIWWRIQKYFFHFCKISTKILSKSGLETKSPYISKQMMLFFIVKLLEEIILLLYRYRCMNMYRIAFMFLNDMYQLYWPCKWILVILKVQNLHINRISFSFERPPGSIINV